MRKVKFSESEKVPSASDLQCMLDDATACDSRGEYDRSEKLASTVFTAIGSWQKVKRQSAEVISIWTQVNNALGVSAQRRGDNISSEKYFTTALNSSEAANDRAGIAKSTHNLGTCALYFGRYREALQYFERAMQIDEELGNKERMAKHLGAMGIVYVRLSDVPSSLEYHQKSLDISREIADLDGIARNLCSIGNILFIRSDYVGAVEHYEQSMELDGSRGNKLGTALCMGNIANVHAVLSDFARALQYYEKALEQMTEINDLLGMSNQLGNMGNVFGQMQDHERALEYYGKALAICEEAGFKSGIEINRGNIGISYRYLGDDKRAQAELEQALMLSRELGNRSGTARHLGNIGVVYKNLRNYAESLKCHEQARQLSEEIGNKWSVAVSLGNLGILYSEHDFEGFDESKAEECFMEAMSIFETLGFRSELCELHQNLAGFYSERQRWEEANGHFRKFYTLKAEVFSEEQRKSVENFNIRLAIADKEREAQMQKLRAEQLENEMKRQQQELSDKALQLVQQTDMLHTFRHNLEAIVHKADTAEKAVKAVRESLKELPESMMNWQKFHEDFHAVHPHFETKLIQAYPTLSATEIKVCCLLRIGMNTREISTLLFISERTVDIHRGHIRKKIGISRGTDVRAVLSSI